MPCGRARSAAALRERADVASDPIAIAKEYIEERDYNGAEHLLGAGLAAPGREAEIQFLLGMIAYRPQPPRNAIASFRRALIFEPNAIRIRLELPAPSTSRMTTKMHFANSSAPGRATPRPRSSPRSTAT